MLNLNNFIKKTFSYFFFEDINKKLSKTIQIYPQFCLSDLEIIQKIKNNYSCNLNVDLASKTIKRNSRSFWKKNSLTDNEDIGYMHRWSGP